VPHSLAADYWEKRKDILYYQAFRILTQNLSQGVTSMIDVGSGACPYLDWFPHVKERTSLDIAQPYVAEGIESIAADFLEWQPERKYQIITCLQVIEHIPRAELFAKKLLSLGGTVIVSVPYKWPAGKTAGHVQDPVDEEKMLQWFKREPNYSYVCREIEADVSRLIHVYERNKDQWRSLKQRQNIRLKRRKEREEQAKQQSQAQ